MTTRWLVALLLWQASADNGSLVQHGDSASTFLDRLGPGSGPWQRASAESVGLSTASLQRAAAEVAGLAPQRQCLLVVKHGKIVHESYSIHAERGKLYETDSLGKIFTAGVIGAAVQRKMLDIDRSLLSYNVTTDRSLWNRTGVDYWPQVTARHLLTQMSAYGLAEPGTLFSYDSEKYIQHLSALLAARSGAPSVPVAKAIFAEPLGVPRLYDYEGSAEISAGGGQMASCEQIARMGQLILNRGRWRNEQSEFTLADPTYMQDLLSPASRGLVDGYGFLAWLNADMTAATASGDAGNVTTNQSPTAHCCGPRWIGNIPAPFGRHTCSNDSSAGTPDCGCCCVAPPSSKGSVAPQQFPCDPSLPVLVEGATTPHQRDPSEYVSRQIVGDSFPEDSRAPPGVHNPPDMLMAMGAYAKYLYVVPSLDTIVVSMGLTFGKSQGCPGGYDDSYSLSLIWNALASALTQNTTNGVTDTTAKPLQSQAIKPAQGVVTQQPTKEEQLGESGGASDIHKQAGGSCKCYCPPGQGHGGCWNVTQEQCIGLGGPPGSAAQSCPAIGVAHGCDEALQARIDVCQTAEMIQWQHSHDANCTQSRPCSRVDVAGRGGGKGRLAYGGSLASASCLCTPTKWASCEWEAGAHCDPHDPYFPPPRMM